MVLRSARPRVFSGIQPSGTLHLGNYLGALRNWVRHQAAYENFFCVVDLHRITVAHDPETQRARTREVAALYLAAGIDPDESTIFVQSTISAHAELAWILNCTTPMGWLGRMTQFKDKSEEKKESVSAGLFTYPVLMAADILLYDSEFVPVGDDQKQHIELCRDVALAFNHRFGEILKVPSPLIQKAGARIMSLTEPTRKMSKSDVDPNAWIGILDPPKTIQKKFARAVTDSLTEVRFDRERPGVFNLLSIYQTLTGDTEEAIEGHFQGKLYGHLKKEVADVVIAELQSVQQRYQEIQEDPGYVEQVLENGTRNARRIADATLKRAMDALGLG